MYEKILVKWFFISFIYIVYPWAIFNGLHYFFGIEPYHEGAILICTWGMGYYLFKKGLKKGIELGESNKNVPPKNDDIQEM